MMQTSQKLMWVPGVVTADIRLKSHSQLNGAAINQPAV